MKTIKLLLSLLALFVFGEVAAQDYVDAINQSSAASASAFQPARKASLKQSLSRSA